jgi:glycoside/pentoside/hexuronide:cation symporter, GPH family
VSVPPTERVPLKEKMFLGLGMTAYGIKDNGFSTFLLIFYNQVLGMDAKIVSLALGLALIIDAFADPIIGYMSDRTYTRWGRRLPWLYITAIPLALTWILLWMPPTDWGDNIFFYLLGVGILVRTLMSCCEVPAVAMIPEMTSDYDERTVVSRYRFLFAWAGGLLMMFLAYDLFLVPTKEHPVGQLNPQGYWLYGLTGAALIALAVLSSAGGLHKRMAKLPDVKLPSIGIVSAFREMRESLSNRAFVIMLCAGAVALTSTQVTYVISSYLYLYVWEFSQGAFAIYPWFLFGSVIAAFFLVVPVTVKLGKREVSIGFSLASVTFWITPFILRLLGFWPEVGTTQSTSLLFVFFFGANVTAVAVQIALSSMIADIVEASELETGRRTEGIFYAAWFFAQKCATGLGIAITGLIVSFSGFPEKAQPGKVPAAAIDNLIISYCSLIVVAAVVSAAIFWRFPINRADHEERVRQLAEQKAA